MLFLLLRCSRTCLNQLQTLCELKRVAKLEGRVVVTGLKKAFPLHMFMDILESSGLKLDAFVDDEAVNCYVAVLTA